MSQSATALAGTLISQRQIVVRVSVLRHQPYRLAVRFDRIGQALQFVEHVAQIKKRQRISWIGDSRAAVKLLRPAKDATVVADRPEVDRRRRVMRIQAQHAFVDLGCFFQPATLLELYSLQEQRGDPRFQSYWIGA